MARSIQFQMPFDVLQVARLTEDELRRELALHLFREQKLSFGKARELAQMSPWAFMHLLGSRDIAVHYDIAEYEEDLQTLKALGRL